MRVKVVFGDREDVLRLLGRSTSYTERSNLTSRSVQWEAGKEDIGVFKGFGDVSGTCGMGGCVLQSRSSSQGLECLQGWSHQFTTPAMAAGLTDHPWSIKEPLTVLSLPRLSNT